MSAVERHYSPKEVAEMWAVSEDTVKRTFEAEPGVLILGDATGNKAKRRHRTIRIPESVLERVHTRRSVA